MKLNHYQGKFSPSGDLLPTQGITVIQGVDAGETLYQLGRQAVTLMKEMGLEEKLAILPADSYHVTVMGLLSELQAETRWPQDLDPQADWEQIQAYSKDRFDRLNWPGPIQLQVVDLTAEAILLEPLTVKDQYLLATYRQDLAELFGQPTQGLSDYQFHMSLAYILSDLTAAEQAQLKSIRQQILSQVADDYVFVLDAVKLTYYPHMHTFIEIGG